jgi:hypothetical protein
VDEQEEGLNDQEVMDVHDDHDEREEEKEQEEDVDVQEPLNTHNDGQEEQAHGHQVEDVDTHNDHEQLAEEEEEETEEERREVEEALRYQEVDFHDQLTDSLNSFVNDDDEFMCDHDQKTPQEAAEVDQENLQKVINYRCNHCNFVTTMKSALIKHRAEVHDVGRRGSTSPAMDSSCDDAECDQGDLVAEKRKLSPPDNVKREEDMEVEETEQRYSCQRCHNSSYSTGLSEHDMKVHLMTFHAITLAEYLQMNHRPF